MDGAGSAFHLVISNCGLWPHHKPALRMERYHITTSLILFESRKLHSEFRLNNLSFVHQTAHRLR